MLSLRRIVIPFIVLLIAVFALGTIGYRAIEAWTWLDSLYMTAITLTTVGFGEVRPLSDAGRIFTVFLIFLGVGSVAYGFSILTQYFLAADLGPRLRRRRIRRMIRNLQDHIIVCGYGRVGRSALNMLRESSDNVVVIDQDEALASEVRERGIAAVWGDATRDDTLREAGIERASGLIASAGDDADNLFIVLSARTLNPELHIVARTVNPENEAKMQRAGADRVVSPYQIGGRQMANILSRPNVTEFLDFVTLDSGLELWLEELRIGPDSPLAGQTVVEANLRRKTGATLVALLRSSSGATLTPDESTRLEAGDELIVLGTRDQLARLEDFARGSG
jgi:voltage-gated potassium channel